MSKSLVIMCLTLTVVAKADIPVRPVPPQDPVKVAEQQQALKQALASYKVYATDLKKRLKPLLDKGDYHGYTRALAGVQKKAMHIFKPNTLFPSIPDANEGRGLYQDPDSLKAKGEGAKTDPIYQYAQTDVANRQPVEMTPSILTTADAITANADAIIDGKANPVTPERVGEKPIFCRTGDCDQTTLEKSEDFKHAANALSSLVGTSHAFLSSSTDPDKMRAFIGKPAHCSDEMLGYKNCCREEGWGVDIKLAHCTDAEKALGKAKQQGRAVYIGRYCAKHWSIGIAKGCASHHKQYCVFPNKMGAIVQRQGRAGQLRHGFGTPKHPDCRGISMEEFGKLDLDKMDFSAMGDALQNNVHLPDADALRKAIDRHAEEMQAGSRQVMLNEHPYMVVARPKESADAS